MKTQLLGQSGLRVSQLCLGAMTFGEDWQWGANRDISRQIFERFAEAGGNFIDTANSYTDGTSEKLVGELIAADRDAWVVATKYSLPDHMGLGSEGGPSTASVAKVGNSRKNMMRSVEGSLQRLGTDHIDILYLHVWDYTTYPEEIMRAVDDLVRSGKVLYAGISDTPAWIVARAQTLAHLRGWTPFSVLQIEYSLIERTVERELIPMAQALGMSVAPWSPLAGGVLSGKYSAGDKTTRGQDIPARSLEIAESLGEIARQIGCSPSQLALKWLVDRNTIPIVGARKIEQFEDNLKCLDVTISTEQMARLNESSAIEAGFPHDFITSDFVKPMLFGGHPELLDNGLRG